MPVNAGPWGEKYPGIARSWRSVWEQVVPFFAFSAPIRRAIYTTNAIESLNSTVRRAIRTRGHFPNDRAATKLIYLALRDYCRDAGIVFTRCRPWRKNDQAFVEQKNGAVVRRIVGHRRLEGPEAAAALSRIYATTRLYVNFFQPSFKLASKRRDGARVSKRYHAPATPAQRLLADAKTPADVCACVTELADTLDPIRLLR